jgi:hypothetical protein
MKFSHLLVPQDYPFSIIDRLDSLRAGAVVVKLVSCDPWLLWQLTFGDGLAFSARRNVCF